MDIFVAPIPEQIVHCEDAIECLKSRLRFYRARLKKLRKLMDEADLTSNDVQESSNEHHD